MSKVTDSSLGTRKRLFEPTAARSPMKLDADQIIAEAASSHVHFDFSKLSARDRYKLLIGTVIPRPIAFVTPVHEHGVGNAAPFSFFNCLSSDPAIVAIGIENHPD